MSLPVSPLAPKGGFPALPSIGGLRLATAATGLKYVGRDDVMLAVLDPGTAIAGVFTTSATRSAAVLDCQEKLGGGSDGPAAILVNAGNANAFTGRAGVEAVLELCKATSEATGAAPSRIFTASTGVIGEPLDHGQIAGHLDTLAGSAGTAGFEAAARAISTTDTFPKGAGRTLKIDGRTISISGIVKGSGMIAPDMATMLAFVFTDAAVAPALLQDRLAALADESFNAITVDGDTSTSDTLLVAATGAADMAPIVAPDDPRLPALEAALGQVMRDLALQVVRDGEGATKLVRITVTGAEDAAAARRVGRAIANSPLVKTAIAGADPNWGRIVMAVGKAGERADRDRLTISLGDMVLAREGQRAPGYDEAAAAAYMRRDEIAIGVDLGIGAGLASVWTCDLTHAYVSINADYRS